MSAAILGWPPGMYGPSVQGGKKGKGKGKKGKEKGKEKGKKGKKEKGKKGKGDEVSAS